MAIINVPVVAALLLLSLVTYKYIIYPAFFSPLARIPCAHWSACFSPLWILYYRQRQKETLIVHAAHARLGPLIRLAPNDLSVNSVEGGIRTIYGGGFEKGNWYSNAFSNYDHPPMFAMERHAPHSKRKRMLSNVYAKSTLHTSAALKETTRVLLTERLVPRLEADVRAKRDVEFFDLTAALFMDATTTYVFGLRSGSDFLVKQREEGVKFARDFKRRQPYVFWPQDMPRLTSLLTKLGLKRLIVPAWADDAHDYFEDWLLGCCDAVEEVLRTIEQGDGPSMPVEDYPTVYAQLRNGLRRDNEKAGQGKTAANVENERLSIASELLDHSLAGFDTSSITVTWMAWELSQPHNLHWQKQLHDELQTLDPEHLDSAALDALPLTHAILMESLRLHPAIPGNQPRVTTAPTTTLGDAETGQLWSGIPAGVRVQAQALSLHQNADVFPNPEKWDPSRWMLQGSESTERERAMHRWFWAFGSGGRMCVGSNLAMHSMKAAMIGVWRRFRTTIADDEGMVMNGGWLGEPLGVGKGGKIGIGEERKFLLLKVEEAE